MLEISFRFDPEYDLSAKDPVGDLTISDGQSVLIVKEAYLDFCFAALTDACKRLVTVDNVSEDVGEPDQLIVERIPGGNLRLSYGNQTLMIGTFEAFEAAVRQATESFLKSIKSLPDFDENDFPRLLQQYADWKYE